MPKPGTEKFTQGWQKTVDWAQKNKIPYAAYYSVYQLDSQRFVSGTPMSEAERVNAIQSAAGLNVTTALPTDAPNPANVPGNIKSNAANIFTGLEGIFTGSFEKNLWDTLTNTVEHPSSIYGAFDLSHGLPGPWQSKQQIDSYMQNMSNHITAQHNALAFVPGMYDLAQLQKPGGARLLATQPITSLLDVLPLGKTLPRGIANSTHVDEAGLTLGDRVAQKLGVTKEALGKMDSIQFTYRLAKTLHLPNEKTQGVISDANGNPIAIKPVTIGERIENYRRTTNTSSTQGELLKGNILKAEKGSKAVEALLKPVDAAFSLLNDDERLMAMKALADDHRPESEVVNDSKYTIPVQEALQQVYDYGHYALNLKLQSGKMISIQTPFGVENYSIEAGSSGPLLVRMKKKAEDAQEVLDKASKPFDALTVKVNMADQGAQGAFAALEQQTQAIWGSIKKSLPSSQVTDPVMTQLRGTMPADERWMQAAVDQQTPLFRNLLGLPPEVGQAERRLFPDLPPTVRLSLHHVKAVNDLFQPGGLLDQATKAYKDEDWIAMSKYTRAATRKFNNKAFEHIPKDNNAFLFKVKQLTDKLHDYAVQREKDTNAMTRMMDGTRHGTLMANGKFAKNSIMALTKRASEAHQAFVHTAIHHAPDVWRNTYLNLYVDGLMRQEHSAGLVDAGAAALIKKGYDESVVEKLRQDPRTIIELMARSAKNTLENNMMPDFTAGAAKRASEEAYAELASLRAKGPEYAPAYIPAISPHDVVRGLESGYNVYIGSIVPKSVSSTFARAFEFTSSIYDVQLAIRKDAIEQITNDVTQEYFNEYVKPQLEDGGALREIVGKYVQHEMQTNVEQLQASGVRGATVDALIEAQIKRMGRVAVDPTSRFGTFSGSNLMSKDFYMDEHLLSAVDKSLTQFQFPAEGFWDKGTKLFRFSILGLSPRYTMHILVGGTALIAYRGHASMLTQLRAGWHVANSGQLPEDIYHQAQGTLSAPRQAIRDFRIARKEKHQQVIDNLKTRYPGIEDAVMQTAAEQEGQADILFHRAGGYTVGNKMIQQEIDKHQWAGTMWDWIKAAATVNTRFTRNIVKMQRTVIYLDGAARATREGHFNELVSVPTVDKNGEQVINSTTGKPMFHQEERRSEMTPEQAHDQGMRQLIQVMGDVRHMTPLERQWLVRAFPFYGWTKHILTYVLTYPIDHPYRALVLSQLATMASADVPSGLPTRIQLLMFLGHPDQYGNVSAIDARVADPLRDTANYASVTGFFQSLNPILSAPMAYMDPQVVFGANELYPKVTYSQLYGVKEAGPQGNAYTVAEQFVPQLTALDQAFNLSGQYGYLKTANPEAFSKKIYQSLNVPFFQVQHINLDQIAAKQELDRLSIAKQAAYEAASTGDMSYLAGYPATAQLPDPLNTNLDVTPAYIEAMTKQSEDKYGLPFTETSLPPPTPAL